MRRLKPDPTELPEARHDTGGPSPLDVAHAAMNAAQDPAAADLARLRFYQCLADSELILWLATEAEGDAEAAGVDGTRNLAPRVFTLEDGPVVLVFDAEERLAALAQEPVPYAVLPGRVVAAQLAGQGVGLGLNLGVAPSSFLLDASGVAWLAETLGAAPQESGARIQDFGSPPALPAALLHALEAQLIRVAPLAAAAYLARAEYEGGSIGPILMFVDAAPAAAPALARAVTEAAIFSGAEGVRLDIGFRAAAAPDLARLIAVGRHFDLAGWAAAQARDRAEVAQRRRPKAPGSDPDAPPILR